MRGILSPRKITVKGAPTGASLARRSLRKRRPRHCNPGGNCVEMAELLAGSVAVRNSRIPDGPALIFTRAGWRLSVVVPCQAGHPRGPGKVIVS